MNLSAFCKPVYYRVRPRFCYCIFDTLFKAKLALDGIGHILSLSVVLFTMAAVVQYIMLLSFKTAVQWHAENDRRQGQDNKKCLTSKKGPPSQFWRPMVGAQGHVKNGLTRENKGHQGNFGAPSAPSLHTTECNVYFKAAISVDT